MLMIIAFHASRRRLGAARLSSSLRHISVISGNLPDHTDSPKNGVSDVCRSRRRDRAVVSFLRALPPGNEHGYLPLPRPLDQ